jgi:hypothetical protein
MKIDLNNYTKYKVKRGSCSIALVVMWWELSHAFL